MSEYRDFSGSDDAHDKQIYPEHKPFEESTPGTSQVQNQKDTGGGGTHLHGAVDGPVHTGTGDINILFQSAEKTEHELSKAEPALQSMLNYLGQSSIGKAITGPLRFTLSFAFIVGSVLLIMWLFPENVTNTLIGIYLLGLIIWWISSES